jgi:hypothetical protein
LSAKRFRYSMRLVNQVGGQKSSCQGDKYRFSGVILIKYRSTTVDYVAPWPMHGSVQNFTHSACRDWKYEQQPTAIGVPVLSKSTTFLLFKTVPWQLLVTLRLWPRLSWLWFCLWQRVRVGV